MAALQAGAGADLGWARALVEKGLEASARGDTISLYEHKARNADRLAAASVK